MSVEAPTRPDLASDDGSGNEQDWRKWNAETDGLAEMVDGMSDDPAVLGVTEASPDEDRRLSTYRWEARARDAHFSRGYEFRDLSKMNHFVGDVATTGFDRRNPISDYGMPRIQTRRRIGGTLLPRPQ